MDNNFYLLNGRAVKNISELIEVLKKIDKDTFSHHVNDQKNDFATWIKDVFNEKALADKLTKAKSKSAMLKLLQENNNYETIILGAGFAGIASAIYASRKRMKYKILSKDIGGQIAVSGNIENYPGFKHTDYLELMKNLKEQMEYNNIVVEEGIEANKIIKQKNVFKISTNKGDFLTKSIIIATGARARKLNVPGEDKFSNNGLTYCAICDGPLFKGKDIVVVGGGNSALEAADFLLNIANKIYVLNITKEIKGYEYLMEKIKGKVEIINNAKTKEILGDKFVTGLKYEQNGQEKEIKIEGVFVEIGRESNTEFLKGFIDLDKHNHIKINKFCETSVEGIYAAGDCTDVHEYQYAIAGGLGCMALLRAARYLANK